MPFTTWERMSPRDFQFFVLASGEPVEQKEPLWPRCARCWGERHGFDADSTNTLVPYFDAFERKAKIDAVFGGLEVFFGAVGVLILLLGAVGVANVVLMSVAARTFEFGLRRALGCKRRWIFGQVFLEAGLVCVLSRGCSASCSAWSASSVMQPRAAAGGLRPPQAELAAAWLPGISCSSVSLGAAIWPAWRAARMSPVDGPAGRAQL